MYTNIPVTETIGITRVLLTQNNVDVNIIEEVTELLKIITQQNYFHHNEKYYIQNDGLPMGSPLSGTLANIYLNNFEQKFINNRCNAYKNNIIYWHRYVDDILLLFKGTLRQLANLHNYINSINQNIKFTLELETEKSINFLDLNIRNNNAMHNFKIFRKPTQTNHTIHCTSNHPSQHKYAAYNHMICRLNNIPMNVSDYNEELQTIISIATQNGFTSDMIYNINSKIKHKMQQNQLTTMYTSDNVHNDNNKKYISLIYNNKSSHIASKIFKKFNYTIAHKTNEKLQQKLKPQQNEQIDSGIYRLICNECPKFYIGQTGRSFTQRFKEHTQEATHTHKTMFKSNYAEHLNTEKHTYTDINTNLQVIHSIPKGSMMDRLEELEIYKHRNNPLLMNDKVNTHTNKLYEKILYS